MTSFFAGYENEFQPVGLQESNLVQSLAETAWRVRRMVALESSIFAKGRIEFAQQFAEHKPELRDSLIDVHTFSPTKSKFRAFNCRKRASRAAPKRLPPNSVLCKRSVNNRKK
jgi:hypothetical protein